MQPQMQQPIQQRMENQYQTMQPIYKQPNALQGKTVDSIEVVKASEIPLDGSISYFPIADGTAIVTKQLQMDGTSKTIIYKPIESEDNPKPIKYITETEFNETIQKFDVSALKDEIKQLKKQIKDITRNLKDKEESEDE